MVFAVLDPWITYAELEVDYTNDPELLEGLQRSKVALHKHFNRFYACTKLSPTTSIVSSTTLSAVDMLPILSQNSDTPVFDFTACFQCLLH